jgi:hypothetical protein
VVVVLGVGRRLVHLVQEDGKGILQSDLELEMVEVEVQI